MGDVPSVVVGHAFGALVEGHSFFEPGECLFEPRHDDLSFLYGSRVIFFFESHDKYIWVY